MKPTYLIGAAFCVAVVVLSLGVYDHATQMPFVAPASTTTTVMVSSTQDATSSGSSGATATQSYTMAQVEQHNSATSCWSAINGDVYDLTNWIDQHPGGPEHILAICGTDGSASFNAQHAGDAQVEATLQQFYIGTLARS